MDIMKKTVLALILGIALLAAFGTEAKAQIPKEGTISCVTGFSGTAKILPMGQEDIGMTYELMGAIISDTDADPYHDTSFRCLGTLHAVKGEFNDDRGFCVSIRPDGDKIFWTFKGAGKVGPGGVNKGTFTIVGGTGKMTGIQGSTEYTVMGVRPAAEGTFQDYMRCKGWYKLP